MNTLKLSEAIRLGAMLKPQAFGGYHPFRGGSCAIGAALDAVGGQDCMEYSYWPELEAMSLLDCPQCGAVVDQRSARSLIPHLNDDHRWTRERIADWVATIEPAVVTVGPETVEVSQ